MNVDDLLCWLVILVNFQGIYGTVKSTKHNYNESELNHLEKNREKWNIFEIKGIFLYIVKIVI